MDQQVRDALLSGNKEELEDVVAEEIAAGLQRGSNVADLQQALNDSKSGRAGSVRGLASSLVGGRARSSE